MPEVASDRERWFTTLCTPGHGFGSNRGMRLWPLCALPLLWGCANDQQPSEGEKTYQPLVELDGWSGVARDDDPFVVDADAPDCVGDGFRIETEQKWVEIDTTACNWVTLRGRALHAVDVGQELQLDVSHYDLDAAEPASAELRLTLEGCAAWSKSIPIPGEANVYEEHFSSPCALEENGKVLFHLHNHGQNTYQLRSLLVLR